MFKKNLKQILSSFEKTISQLDSLATGNTAAVENNLLVISRIENESKELSAEADQATRVAIKLRQILE